jgi:hypothetical protein
MLERFQMVTPEKIEFVNSLMKKSGRTRELFSFLEANHCVNNDFVQRFFQLPTNLHAQNIISKLDELHKDGKLSLVSYDWTILPQQRLSLLLVASTDSIEITVE